MAYQSGESWIKAMTRLFNRDGRDMDDKAVDTEIRAAASCLFVPGETTFDIDGRSGDFEGLVESAHRVHKATTIMGACVGVTIVDFKRDDLQVDFSWRIHMQDHLPSSGHPPATRPLPPAVEVSVQATLDKPGPEGRAIAVVAKSRATTVPDSDDD